MTPMTDEDRAHLAKILGLLGSDHAGERAAAGLKAHRYVQARGQTWGRVLAAETLYVPVPAPPDPPPTIMDQAAARWALGHDHGELTSWERGFLKSLAKFHTLSAKQRGVLRRLVQKVAG